MFAFDYTNVSPDIMTISKGLTGGYMPMAITITTQKIYDAFYADYSEGKAFMHSHTYSGNPLGCTAALAVQKILREEHILEKAQDTAKYLHAKLQDVFENHPNVGEIRHLGLINAIELVQNKDTKQAFASDKRLGYQIYKLALTKGLLLRPLGDVLYFNPPLNIDKETLDKAIDLCYSSINETLHI